MHSDTVEDEDKTTSRQVLFVADRSPKVPRCFSQLKIFIVALSFVFFSKALAGTYMKSAITQIERRFDLSSSLTGLIDGGFEMGNLLLLAVVSHFGARLHRPRLIAAGCTIMAVGSAVSALPHFFMGRYKYDTIAAAWLNESFNIVPCLEPKRETSQLVNHLTTPPGNGTTETEQDCKRDTDSYMWLYLFLGNALRGIGETPVTPLGISYIDDFAEKPENSAFYIACLQSIALLGPMFGFLLGALCAKLYVDVGFVNEDSVTIAPSDTRWVGAWWLGFFISAAIMFLASLPFWFLPKSLLKDPTAVPQSEIDPPSSPADEMTDIAKGDEPLTSSRGRLEGFFPSLRRLLCTPVYFLLLCESILKFNSYSGLFAFKAKYMEQQFGQSAFQANFFIGVLNIPAVVVAIFLGGVLMKRLKLNVVSGAQLSLATSFLAYLLIIAQFGINCENLKVAGLTATYNGTPGVFPDGTMIQSSCNEGCSCPTTDWDPVCSDNGITYMSPCLAGCTSSTRTGKIMMFHNCSCVGSSPPPSGSMSVSLGQCARSEVCSIRFIAYMTVSVICSFIDALGTTPGYMVIIWCIKPELKSLALGIQTLVTRTLGGIPGPVYFGALIDTTCLKWGARKCQGTGACRIYNSDMYRVIFLGLITCLKGSSYFFNVGVIVLLRRQRTRGGLNQAEVELQHTQRTSDECLTTEGQNQQGDPPPRQDSGRGEGDRIIDQINGRFQEVSDKATNQDRGQLQKEAAH
ncbi:solute carrier organic anion transporter family member 1C1 isoform X2 [Brienomyrus brachyistius]|uniref:solute carrier organic anion transporter family member 1C1 isoform X2 n=1 Tax=Brienomyrus brachyistius TaxID=42636 RepID=UPI0020B3E8EA|nr:solute carrier organic anion transporter family member 1C1 isoform X2 [Brienomyrus brachyistius]